MGSTASPKTDYHSQTKQQAGGGNSSGLSNWIKRYDKFGLILRIENRHQQPLWLSDSPSWPPKRHTRHWLVSDDPGRHRPIPTDPISQRRLAGRVRRYLKRLHVRGLLAGIPHSRHSSPKHGTPATRPTDMRAIHQFVAGFTHGDAISNEARVMRSIFRTWGFQSDIFSETRRILPDLRDEARDVALYRAECKPDDVVLLHLSIGSGVNALFADLPCRKAILYHNITPAEYFKGIQDQIAGLLEQGRRQMKALAGKAAVVIADSSFNARELQDMGYGDVPVLPLVLDLHRLRAHANRYTLDKYGDKLVNVLFVGRCAPNKRLEDGLDAFYYFQNMLNRILDSFTSDLSPARNSTTLSC